MKWEKSSFQDFRGLVIQMKIKGYLLIMLAASLWGFLGPFAKVAMEEGLGPVEIAFWRAALTWVFFAVHAFIKKEYRIQKQDYIWVIVFAVTGIFLFYFSYNKAVQTGGIAMASVLLYTAPAWVAVLAHFIFKEKLTLIKVLAIVLMFIGVVGVSLGASDASLEAGIKMNSSGLIFGLIAGFSYSLYFIFGKKFSGQYSSANLFLYILPIGAICLLPWVAQEYSEKSLKAWMALLALSFLSTYLAYYFYYAGLKYLEATRAVVTASIEPVVAAMVAYLFWHESFDDIGYLGSALILFSVMLMIWETSKMRSKKTLKR